MDCRRRARGYRIAPGHLSSLPMLALREIEFVADPYNFNQLLLTTAVRAGCHACRRL